MAFLSCTGLCYAYSGAQRLAVDHVSLSLERGQALYILGANGSGKSSLARVLSLLSPPQSGGYILDGHDALAQEDPHGLLRGRLGFLSQDGRDQLLSTDLESELSFGLESLCLDKGERHVRIEEAISKFGLSYLRGRPLRGLSPGQRQLVLLASFFSLRLPLLILDEAEASLDPESRDRLAEAKSEHLASSRSIISIQHEVSSIPPTARVLVLDNGAVAFEGQFAAIPDELGLGRYGHLALPQRKRSLGLRPGFPAIRCRGLGFSYPNKPDPILEGVDLEIAQGQCLAVVGRAGSGKSSLLRSISALLYPQRGQVLVLGRDTRDRGVKASFLRSQATHALQDASAALFASHAADDVAFGPSQCGIKGQDLLFRTRRAMDQAGIAYQAFRDRSPRQLSGGERRRLALAGILALDGPILVLDEATESLDPASRRAILSLMFELNASGKTLVMATHSMDEAALADRVIVMDAGRIVFDGSPKDLFARPDIAAWGLSQIQDDQVRSSLADPSLAALSEPRSKAHEPPDSARLEPGPAQNGHRRKRPGGDPFALSTGLKVGGHIPPSFQGLSPVVLLLGFTALSLPALAVSRVAWLSAQLCLLLAIGLAFRLSYAQFLRGAGLGLAFLAFFLALQLVLGPMEKPALLRLGPFCLSFGEFWASLALYLRYLSAMLAFSCLSLALGPIGLVRGATEAARLLGLGLGPRLRLELFLTIIRHFIPILTEEASSISRAQAARGAPGREGGPISSLVSGFSLIVPLCLHALDDARRLSEALVSRGYQAKERAKEPHPPLSLADRAFLMACAAEAVAIIFLNYAHPAWVSQALIFSIGVVR